eukprot:scaffold10717_cov61-Phaeocystis_antarctica.AAC.11
MVTKEVLQQPSQRGGYYFRNTVKSSDTFTDTDAKKASTWSPRDLPPPKSHTQKINLLGACPDASFASPVASIAASIAARVAAAASRAAFPIFSAWMRSRTSLPTFPREFFRDPSFANVASTPPMDNMRSSSSRSVSSTAARAQSASTAGWTVWAYLSRSTSRFKSRSAISAVAMSPLSAALARRMSSRASCTAALFASSPVSFASTVASSAVAVAGAPTSALNVTDAVAASAAATSASVASSNFMTSPRGAEDKLFEERCREGGLRPADFVRAADGGRFALGDLGAGSGGRGKVIALWKAACRSARLSRPSPSASQCAKSASVKASLRTSSSTCTDSGASDASPLRNLASRTKCRLPPCACAPPPFCASSLTSSSAPRSDISFVSPDSSRAVPRRAAVGSACSSRTRLMTPMRLGRRPETPPSPLLPAASLSWAATATARVASASPPPTAVGLPQDNRWLRWPLAKVTAGIGAAAGGELGEIVEAGWLLPLTRLTARLNLASTFDPLRPCASGREAGRAAPGRS